MSHFRSTPAALSVGDSNRPAALVVMLDGRSAQVWAQIGQDASQPLGTLLALIRESLLLDGRYLAEILLDHERISGTSLRALLAHPVREWQSIELTSKLLADVLGEPFRQAVNMVLMSFQGLEVALDLLGQGEESKACERIVSVAGVLPMIVEHLTKLIEAMDAVGWPQEAFRELPTFRDSLTEQAGRLNDALEARDFETLVMLAGGPVATVHRKTMRALNYLARRVERPHRALIR